jgi:hypothetical protein
MNTQENARQALASIYRQLEKDTINIDRARAMIYCALSLSNLLKGQQPPKSEENEPHLPTSVTSV